MPVINMDPEDLGRLVGGRFSLEEFISEIPMMGASVEKSEERELAVEFFPSRPDLFCVEGVARAYRRFKGYDVAGPKRTMDIKGSSGMEVSVDEGLIGIRPVIGCAYIKGTTIDEPTLVSIMNLQEKLHLTIGRKRKKVAIGIHDAGPLKPPFRYWAALPKQVEFVPLQKDTEWDLDRILKYHEKGVDYAWVLEGLDRYPIITDSYDQVLSFPPIINGELTRVSEETKDIFIDCTGWDLRAVSQSVNIVCSQLLERGGELRSVEVKYPSGTAWRSMGLKSGAWPDFSWKHWTLDLDFASKWLGRELTDPMIIDALSRMGYEDISVKGRKLKCSAPPWRGDLLHEADIAEDVAIGHGFMEFPGELSRHYTTASERRSSTFSRLLREVMVGLGYLEVVTISLSSEEEQFTLMGRSENDHIRITNPISKDHTMVRLSAIPSLLSLLQANKHRDLPQRIFEVADVMVGNLNRKVLCSLNEDSKASFTEMKGIVQRVMSDLQVPFLLGPAGVPWYIRGRGAGLYTEKDALPREHDYDGPFQEMADGKSIPIGHFGELAPGMIVGKDLSTPVSCMELDLDLIMELMEGRR